MSQLYSTQAARIGKLKGEILKRAMAVEVLGITGQQRQVPKNNSDTVVYRRYLPYGGVDNQWVADGGDTTFVSAHLTAEGVTPSADSITATDVTAVLQEYAALYSYSNKVGELYEDDIPAEMVKQTGERLGLVREMVRFGALKAATSKFYGGTGTSRATVNGVIDATTLRKIERSLLRAHGKFVKEILAPSPNFGTAPVQSSFIVFAHTDVIADVEGLSGYKPVAEYGSRKVCHEMERGSWGSFRFVHSPELVPVPDSGAAIGTDGLLSTTGTLNDVYQVLVVAMDAWGQCALRGMDSIKANHIPLSATDTADPLGQRGYVGARTWFDTTILNDGWMALFELAVTDL